MYMSRWRRKPLWVIGAWLSTAGLAAGLTLGGGAALADPPQPPAPPADPAAVSADPVGVPASAPEPGLPPPPDAPPPPLLPAPVAPPPPAESPVPPDATPAATETDPGAGQNAQPFTGAPPFLPPSFNPVNGATVGVAKPIIINFQRPIGDKAMAEQAIHISSVPPVSGKFYWMTPSQVRWRPLKFWPADTTVNIDAAGTTSSFRTGDSLIATADDATHQMTIARNGVVEKTFPMSMGMSSGGHETPNGTYYVLEKFPTVVMDSSTYGVPVNSTWGYKVTVQDAVRIDNSGGFVHSAPWSVNDQGKRNVSHGCINLSPANAKWFYDNFGSGDPVVVKNSIGSYTKPDGANDWQI